ARAAHQSGLDLLMAHGDARGASSCRLNLALIANLTGDLESARIGCNEALALLGGTDDLWAVASILSNLGEIAGRMGRTSEAADYYERVIEIYRRLEDHDRLAIVAGNTAEMRLVRGEIRQAEVLIEQAVAQFRAESNLVQLAPSLYLQAAIQSAMGQTSAALATFRESILLSQRQHNAFDIAYSLEAIARLHLLAGDADLALRLWSGMEALRTREQVPEYPLLTYQETKRQIRERFGEPLDHPEGKRGASMSSDQLVTEATNLGTVTDGQKIAIYRLLDQTPTTGPTDKHPTPRQREILQLMADGQTTRQIAEKLHISPRTVERHISQIFTLLGADRRSAATAIATAMGLLE
ncbi:MAG TPA: tetratricopeptide repeat protein, partial [Thermomicrobiales bacterium]|nr:tetratricopeptide repeat protein [Thermomicrobiales bacterium]